MGANRKLIAEGATSEKRSARRTRRGDADESKDVAELTPMLEHGESIRECAGCGARFVSSRTGGDYCSQISCQLKARSR
jgi:hypothetical protein